MEIDTIRHELREIEEAKARAIIFKAKSNWALFGECPNGYFLNLEKRKCKERTLNSLKREDGTEVTTIADILDVGKSFYENLYKGQEDSLLPVEEVKEALAGLDFPTLSDEYRESLEVPFSEEELLKKALSH